MGGDQRDMRTGQDGSHGVTEGLSRTDNSEALPAHHATLGAGNSRAPLKVVVCISAARQRCLRRWECSVWEFSVSVPPNRAATGPPRLLSSQKVEQKF